MVAEFMPIEAAESSSRDLRVMQMVRQSEGTRPIPPDELAERVEIELRGSPLFDDVPVRRGRKKPRLGE